MIFTGSVVWVQCRSIEIARHRIHAANEAREVVARPIICCCSRVEVASDFIRTAIHQMHAMQ
nr:hypothetical protein [uncultured bacterium]